MSGEPDGYDFEGPTRFDKLFTGIAVERPKSLDPHDRCGTEGITADETFDGDYGRLLDRVEKRAEGVASPMPASWNQIVPWLRQIDGLRRAA